MSASITFNPYAQGSARGTFGILSEGYIQGLSYDDPIHRYDLVNGILASTETLPMWGGVGIYEDLPAAGAGSTTPNASLGTVVGRATTLTPYTQGVLGGFSVLDYNFAAIQTPQSQVPLSGSNGQVNFYRIGSKKRIAVQIDSTFAATLLGGPTYPELAWDFTNQKLIAFTTGTALQVRVVEINIGNSMVVSYNSGTGAATWVYNGSAAIIELVEGAAAMALIAPPIVTIDPSYVEPGLILPYLQASGAFDLLPTGEPRARLSEHDLAVYYKRVDMRSGRTTVGQSSTGMIAAPFIAMSYFSAPTYLLQMTAEYNHHDVAAAGRWGVALDNALRLAVWEAFAQTMRVALLYGMNPANGEGLAYLNGATAINLPPDSNGNTRASTYDNGQMSFFLAQQIGAIKTRTNNMGIGRTFTIVGPQQDLELFEYNVVQVTQYQRPGAGTDSTKGVLKRILMENGDELIWAYDDTLIGKGAGGTDLVIIAMPTVAKQRGNRTFDTNKFADLEPGIEATLDQLVDMSAPLEITSPMARGATDKLYELRTTSGIGIRPEAITLVSMAN